MAIQRINLGTAPSGTGGDTNRSAFTKIDGNFADTTHAASRLVGTAAGNVMEVGAFGLGASPIDYSGLDYNNYPRITTFFRSNGGINSPQDGFWIQGIAQHIDNRGYQLAIPINNNPRIFIRNNQYGGDWSPWYELKSTLNTSIDGNGFIKAASPIVKLFSDKIELNAEAKLQPITLEKLGVGDYLVKGSLGFAQEGWYIEMPKDANGNVLVAVVYEQLDNNDISVKTYAKKFDEETGDVVANTAKPRDIPATRWIDLRLQALPQPTQPLSEDETVTTNAE